MKRLEKKLIETMLKHKVLSKKISAKRSIKWMLENDLKRLREYGILSNKKSYFIEVKNRDIELMFCNTIFKDNYKKILLSIAGGEISYRDNNHSNKRNFFRIDKKVFLDF